MAVAQPTPGRRERNKRDKLDRITAAARDLFAARGVDDVTTRQIVFGDSEETRHRDAPPLTVRTEQAIAAVVHRHPGIDPAAAGTFAHVVSAAMFLAMAATADVGHTVEQIVDDIRGQLQVLLPR